MTQPLRVAVAQIDTTVGDFEGNAEKILKAGRAAERQGAHLVLFPELAVCGYPPKDLLERRSFLAETERTTRRLTAKTKDAVWLFGSLERNRKRAGRTVFNAAVAARDGRLVGTYHKRLLPTYDVFDEGRYFEPGSRPLVLNVRGSRVGVTVCEDIWNDKTFWRRPLYKTDPLNDLRRSRVDLHANIAASPWTLGKDRLRQRMMSQIARRTGVPLVSCNLVGGNDGLVFDGGSSAFDDRGRLIARGKAFEEDLWLIELPGGAGPRGGKETDVGQMRRALVLALSDYASKCGFRSAVLGLSGGIDSAVTAALAVEALGPASVVGVAMPGPYSSEGSLRDARDLARNLGIRLLEIPIGPVFEAYRRTLAAAFGEGDSRPAEENLQARIRGALLMALSNRFGHLVLSTGNKSELAVGYCTLYGDMAGGYALLSDIPKALVYSLAHDINANRAVIPSASIEKDPSAELAPNQKDSDTLPPYPVLDPLIEALVEQSLPAPAAARKIGISPEAAREIAARLDRNEYKRRQMPPGPKVTGRAFGEGRRYPIAQKFRL
ncbi:MAG TPA: NAD+ synthase [Thermoanaerobaculia bacterium]|nr:NAD+ synthase [Thermoanaerobaculia bacterium]